MTKESIPVKVDREKRAQIETCFRQKPVEVPFRAARVNRLDEWTNYPPVVRAVIPTLTGESIIVDVKWAERPSWVVPRDLLPSQSGREILFRESFCTS